MLSRYSYKPFLFCSGITIPIYDITVVSNSFYTAAVQITNLFYVITVLITNPFHSVAAFAIPFYAITVVLKVLNSFYTLAVQITNPFTAIVVSVTNPFYAITVLVSNPFYSITAIPISFLCCRSSFQYFLCYKSSEIRIRIFLHNFPIIIFLIRQFLYFHSIGIST